jgi:hypothetical protein
MTDYVRVVAIAGLVVVEVAAIWAGIDGVVLSLVVALIAGIAGYKLSDYVRETIR